MLRIGEVRHVSASPGDRLLHRRDPPSAWALASPLPSTRPKRLLAERLLRRPPGRRRPERPLSRLPPSLPGSSSAARAAKGECSSGAGAAGLGLKPSTVVDSSLGREAGCGCVLAAPGKGKRLPDLSPCRGRRAKSEAQRVVQIWGIRLWPTLVPLCLTIPPSHLIRIEWHFPLSLLPPVPPRRQQQRCHDACCRRQPTDHPTHYRCCVGPTAAAAPAAGCRLCWRGPEAGRRLCCRQPGGAQGRLAGRQPGLQPAVGAAVGIAEPAERLQR